MATRNCIPVRGAQGGHARQAPGDDRVEIKKRGGGEAAASVENPVYVDSWKTPA